MFLITGKTRVFDSVRGNTLNGDNLYHGICHILVSRGTVSPSMKMTGSGGRESYIGRAVKLNMTGDTLTIL